MLSPLRPILIDVFQDGDTVIILFEAQATMINGDIYRNSYAWFFTMEGNEVKKVRVVLDLDASNKLMTLKIDQ